MARTFVCDRGQSITAAIEAADPVFAAALQHEKAESVMRCAVLMGLCALAEGGTWPMAALQAMAVFMATMKSRISIAQRLDGALCEALDGTLPQEP